MTYYDINNIVSFNKMVKISYVENKIDAEKFYLGEEKKSGEEDDDIMPD